MQMFPNGADQKLFNYSKLPDFTTKEYSQDLDSDSTWEASERQMNQIDWIFQAGTLVSCPRYLHL